MRKILLFFKNKKLHTPAIFVLGVFATIFFERITDKVFPKDIEVVDLAKDTLYVIPVIKDSVIDNSLVKNEKNENLLSEIEYWKSKAKSSENHNIDIQKKLNDIDKKIENLEDNSQLELTTSESKLFNEIISNPKNLFINKKGYQATNSTNLFKGECPDFSSPSDYIDLYFEINNKSTFDNTATIFLTMTGINEKDERYYIYDEYYKPQNGANLIRIKNIKKTGKYVFTFGLIFKSELSKEFPSVKGFTCYFNK